MSGGQLFLCPAGRGITTPAPYITYDTLNKCFMFLRPHAQLQTLFSYKQEHRRHPDREARLLQLRVIRDEAQ